MSQQDRPRIYHANYMTLHSSIEEAKEWIPRPEHEDIRSYVEKSAYDKLEAALTVATEALELIQEQTELIKDRYAFGGERIVPTCGAYKARKALERIKEILK